MSDHGSQNNTGQAKRVVVADRYRDGTMVGELEIHAYTKHGSSSIIGVLPSETLEPGEVLKTKAWVLGARQLVVLGEHKKPLKLAGRWYEVRVVKTDGKQKK